MDESISSPFFNKISSFAKESTELFNSIYSNVSKKFILNSVLNSYEYYILDKDFYKYSEELENIEDPISIMKEYYSLDGYKNIVRIIDEVINSGICDHRQDLLSLVIRTIGCDNKIMSKDDKMNLIIPILFSTLDFILKKQIPRGFSLSEADKRTVPANFRRKDFDLNNSKYKLFTAYNYLHIVDYLYSYEKGLKMGAFDLFKHRNKEVALHSLDRNSIMHGDEVNYGTEENLIRLVNGLLIAIIAEKEIKLFDTTRESLI